MSQTVVVQAARVFVFRSTYLTFKAERVFREGGVVIRVVTKPRGISSDCGLAIRVEAADEERAERLLLAAGIEKLGVWSTP